MVPSDKEIEDAVRVLMAATDGELFFGHGLDDEAVPVVVLPADIGNGLLQYQVSNGMPGERTESHDFGTLREAMNDFAMRTSGKPHKMRPPAPDLSAWLREQIEKADADPEDYPEDVSDACAKFDGLLSQLVFATLQLREWKDADEHTVTLRLRRLQAVAGW